MNRWHAFKQLLLARFREFYREPIAIFWVYGFPLIIAVVLGMAFRSGAVPPPKVDVATDADPSRAAQIVQQLNEKKIEATERTKADCEEDVKRGVVMLYLEPSAKEILYVYDPHNAKAVEARYWVDSVLLRASGAQLPYDDVELTDPSTRYIAFLFPGLVGMNIMGGGMFGIGFVLVEMRARKLFKRLMASPMNRADFLLSIMVSRLLFLIPEMISLLVVARWLFDVPMNGNWALLMLSVLLGATAFAGIGLLIASRTEKTETASGLVNLIVMPMWLFSGVFFAATNFPAATQPFVQALPLTQLINALRGIMLHGEGIAQIWPSLAILAAYTVVTFTLALRWFKWT
jgi:ABC-2 type transport system permease protein